MGIPRFYRWLTERYPLILQPMSKIPNIDNLYLDMNEILHRFSHSEGFNHLLPHISLNIEFEKIMSKTFSYIETLFQLVKPRKLLYLAVDGVCPSAKFSCIREFTYKFIYDLNEFNAKEKRLGRKASKNYFDNCNIYPGTNFMQKVNESLSTFIKWKISSDENWRKIQVIFSGGDIPGEGEHKIIQHIRNSRNSPNISHCIYSNDADLILLSLATHEPYIVLLREELLIESYRTLPPRKKITDPPKYECLMINLLREYLKLEYGKIRGMDFERLIDDLILLMVLLGNDFLPKLPVFDIGEGVADLLFELYIPFWRKNRYLTLSGVINMNVFKNFLTEFSQYETDILRKRLNRKEPPLFQSPMTPKSKNITINEIIAKSKEEENQNEESKNEEKHFYESKETRDLKQTLRSLLNNGVRKLSNYYNSFILKKSFFKGNEEVKELVIKYLEGLQWIMYYYFKGVRDWQWYYPFYYAPMIFEFASFNFEINPFKFREPCLAYEQLMCIIPPESKYLLPDAYSDLMNDPELAKFFPARPTIEHDIISAKINCHSLKTIVPLIPYDLLMQKTQKISEVFEANRVGKIAVFKYSFNEALNFVQSEIPKLIPDFNCCVNIEYPEFECKISEPALLEGTLEKLGGFPSLHNFPFNHELQCVSSCNFPVDHSRKHLILKFNQVPTTLNEAYNLLFNKTVYFEYPNNEYGLVVRLSNHEGTLPKVDIAYLESIEMTNLKYLRLLRANVESCILYSHGITIKPSLGIVVHYYPLSVIKRNFQGKLVPVWENIESFAPLELVSTDRLPGHPREFNEISPSQIYSLCSKVIILKKKKIGYLGEIVKYNGNNILVLILRKPKQIFSEVSRLSRSELEKYYSVNEVSEMLDMNKEVINRIMGSIKIKMPSYSKILEVGLNLKNDDDFTSVLNWARWRVYPGFSGWEYSEKAVITLENYIEAFPQFFEGLMKSYSKENLSHEDLFSYTKYSNKEIEQVALWVFKLSSYGKSWTSAFSERLCKSTIEKINKVTQSVKNESISDVEIFKPNQIVVLSKPWNPLFSDKNIQFNLGDRVMNLNPYYYFFVQFAAEGTIVALINAQYVEVLWDDVIIKSHSIFPTENLLNLTSSYKKTKVLRSKSFDSKILETEVFNDLQSEDKILKNSKKLSREMSGDTNSRFITEKGSLNY